MAFKIGSNTSISDTPNISFSLLINKPAIMAQTSTLSANNRLRSGNVSISGNTLVLTTSA